MRINLAVITILSFSTLRCSRGRALTWQHRFLTNASPLILTNVLTSFTVAHLISSSCHSASLPHSSATVSSLPCSFIVFDNEDLTIILDLLVLVFDVMYQNGVKILKTETRLSSGESLMFSIPVDRSNGNVVHFIRKRLCTITLGYLSCSFI